MSKNIVLVLMYHRHKLLDPKSWLPLILAYEFLHKHFGLILILLEGTVRDCAYFSRRTAYRLPVSPK
jgi:hypothetical protein